MTHQRRNKPDEEPPSVEEVPAIFRRAREREPESTEALVERAGREPLGIDISDYSDEWCAGFLAGQANGVAELTERLAAAERERDDLTAANASHIYEVEFLRRRVKVLEEALEKYARLEPDELPYSDTLNDPPDIGRVARAALFQVREPS